MRPQSASVHPLEPDPETLRRWIDACADYVVEHVGTLATQPSWNTEGGAELAQTFREAVPESGRPFEAILERLRPAIERSFNTAGPGYLAFIPGGGIPAA